MVCVWVCYGEQWIKGRCVFCWWICMFSWSQIQLIHKTFSSLLGPGQFSVNSETCDFHPSSDAIIHSLCVQIKGHTNLEWLDQSFYTCTDKRLYEFGVHHRHQVYIVLGVISINTWACSVHNNPYKDGGKKIQKQKCYQYWHTEQNASNGAHYFVKAHNFIETRTIQFNVNLKTTTGEKDFFFFIDHS